MESTTHTKKLREIMERDRAFQFLVGLKPKFDLPMINVRHRTISISG